ncbi:hypothetical protein SPF06_17200 [Sinomonas sp. JGH33]|uniref:ABC3 transporter permease protein domain-containing protein n=1 Tax=Sinomonas terricola TaxID=3110330 RepID=A0ABU5TAB9_9MICC|nr:hypothetical protein [Sinomonas sp. JGH33]MEA5456470.1 hypothetical protein [Sinomonas sp. JGH33]
MLKALVRITSFGIAIFLSTLSGIVITTEEGAFPWKTEFIASLDFTHSQVSKDQAIAEFGSLADRTGLRIAKVVPDPNDFFNSRSLYVFGSAGPSEPQDIDWFKPGMRGQLHPARDLGAAALNGPHVYSGSPEAIAEFIAWVDAHGIDRNVMPKKTSDILAQALLETGAWLTFLTCVILAGTMVVAWYVLRAKARALKVLNGTRTARIVAEDLVSLVSSFAGPAIAAVLVSIVSVAIQGKATHLADFLAVLGLFLAAAVGGMMLCALVIGSMTWPSVDGIASRQPPERHFRASSEVLKAATLVLVAVMLPVLGASIAEATNLSNQNAKWQVLKDNVSLRFGLGGMTPDEFGRTYDKPLRDMVAAASEAGNLSFSYALAPRSGTDPERRNRAEVGGFDCIVLVNSDYLRRISPLVGSDATGANALGSAGERVDFESLPEEVRMAWGEQFSLWNRAGINLNGAAESLTYYRYVGREPFPALPPGPGEMAHFRNPLIVVADNPADAFTDDNIEAFLSSGNLTFTDAGWVGDYLQSSPLIAVVLSVDRISDAALYNSQLQNQSAGLKTLSFALVLLALTMSIAVSAMVYAISRSKRLFAQRTAGWPWLQSLARRIAWEAALSAALAIAMFFALGGGKRPEVLWTLAGIPLYLAMSIALHLVFARGVFVKVLARRA